VRSISVTRSSRNFSFLAMACVALNGLTFLSISFMKSIMTRSLLSVKVRFVTTIVCDLYSLAPYDSSQCLFCLEMVVCIGVVFS